MKSSMIVVVAVAAWAQGPVFDAASVKVNTAHETNGEGRARPSINTTPGSLTVRNATLSECIQWAYGVQTFQVSGPGWINSERYDISARAEGGAAATQLRVMLQALLAERFKLVLRREKKELPGYALLVAKGGAKMRESSGEGEPVMTPNRAIMTTQRATMPWFATVLTNPLRAPVQDQTGLTGRYDFSIDVSKYVTPDTGPEGMAIGLREALEQELGLRVEARKLSLETLVVERAEKAPVQN
jgi:uncharacterized protein (TIGR03435 family)